MKVVDFISLVALLSVVAILFFLILRWAILWYWRVNEIAGFLESINNHLQTIIASLAGRG